MGDPSDQHAVWESIAESFDRTRQRTWAHVEEFLANLPPKSRVLDLMCGNGRHASAAVAAGHDVVCADWSRPLVAAAHARHAPGVVADATKLPFADDTFDACIYVAGWHGIPSPAGRRASLEELHRVLKPGGLAQITSWSRDAPRFQSEGTPGEPVDVIIPWRSDGHDAARTYHLTTTADLAQQCQAVGLQVVQASEVSIVSKEPDNLVVTVQA